MNPQESAMPINQTKNVQSSGGTLPPTPSTDSFDEKAPDVSLLKKTKKEQVIEGKIKQNSLFFYGIPLAVGSGILITIFVFVIPFITVYPKRQGDINTVNKSIANTNQSKANLIRLQSERSDINTLLERINNRIPSNSAPGKLASVLQDKAKDFNLEIRNVANTLNVDEENLGSGSSNNQVEKNTKLIERLDIGESEFQIETITNPNLRIRRLYINLELSGTFENFTAFMNAIKTTDPIINLISIEYRESPAESGSTNALATVQAKLQFESYAAFLVDEDKLQPIPKSFDYRSSLDPANITEIPVEDFSWNKAEIEALLSGDVSVLGDVGAAKEFSE